MSLMDYVNESKKSTNSNEVLRNHPYNSNTMSLMTWFKAMAEELNKAPADVNWSDIVFYATNIADLAKNNEFIQNQNIEKSSNNK